MIYDVISPKTEVGVKLIFLLARRHGHAQLLLSVKSCNSIKQILAELTNVENFQLFDAKFYKEEIA